MSLTSDQSSAAPTAAHPTPQVPAPQVPAPSAAAPMEEAGPFEAGTAVLTGAPQPQPQPADAHRDPVVDTLARGRDHLLSLQADEGWWKGELETNVTMDAEDLMLRQFLGILTPATAQETGRWIRSQQLPDGGWATFYGGPSDISTTIEAYVALRLAGDDPQAPHMRSAAEWVRAAGGIAASRVFTRIWLALFGEWSWDDIPVLPAELSFLPPWFPLNIYDFACWARQTVVALTIVGSLRPVRSLGFTLDELRVPAPKPVKSPLRSWAGAFERLDVVLHRYEKRPFQPLRRLALRRAAEWVIARQEADGCWGGIQPPMVYSIMALHLMGYPLNHPVISMAFRALDRFTIREQTPDGMVRRIEACQSPVWDTALAVVALSDAGLPGDDPAMVRAGRWLADEEVRVAGDWAVRRPTLAPGGWAFEFDNDFYPDVDDTAEVVIAIHRLLGDGHGPVDHSDGSGPGSAAAAAAAAAAASAESAAAGTIAAADPGLARELRAAAERGVDWSVGMRSSNGAWGAFDADNVRTLVTKIPFCDFGEVVDPPSADVTAHMVEMLALLGRADHPMTQRAVRWLLDNQEAGGSWFGRWGVNHVYGTGAVVPALISAGVSASHPAILAAAHWLVEHQTSDGGWGEDLRSYREDSWIGRGEPTASQTAWALLALLAMEPERGSVEWESIERGVRWLCDTQRADGTWDEPQFTGTGFPWDFSINYHLYRLVFPVTALGRYVSLTGRATR
ncbi:squalene-hopene/tetraprenyl-beta-curcumene cyclase [Parafrankia irregularis]|uniref:Squalene-hopene/tetraprenyl-beta-curcumene cyclase n=1 Tax=Parafrankia irregularis TaxID=795642 RepID=A0A0S4QQY7_9ACTN|nr:MULTISPECIES: terpene cyclase/mutase family protein [Parafrankia]MBE3202731.1 squalene--hopene cyclase [Parafrankia sp. CH37]CUU57917.1 squalene-hopene/tetraprenyl-beta-curcumene cyclase [Parafrankia irregularis]